MLQRAKREEESLTNDGYAESTERLNAIKDQARRATQVAIDSGKFDELFMELANHTVLAGRPEFADDEHTSNEES